MPKPQGPPQKFSAQAYARLVNQGSLAARDRFGKAIQRDHLVMYDPEAPCIYKVTDVRPVMDPRTPGLIKLTLEALVPLTVMVNQPVTRLFVIGEAGPVPPVAAHPADDQHQTPTLGLTDAEVSRLSEADTNHAIGDVAEAHTHADAPPEAPGDSDDGTED